MTRLTGVLDGLDDQRRQRQPYGNGAVLLGAHTKTKVMELLTEGGELTDKARALLASGG